MPSDRCRLEGNLKAFRDACVDWPWVVCIGSFDRFEAKKVIYYIEYATSHSGVK
jgi:hypothetical protein